MTRITLRMDEPGRAGGALNDVEIWRHEAGRLGWPACAAPVLAVVVTVAVAALAVGSGAQEQQVSLALLTGLEALLPLAVAMAATSVVAAGHAAELHLSLPTTYATVLIRRLGLLIGGASAVAVVFSFGIRATGLWTGPPLIASLLVWAAPLAWLASLAVFSALLTRSLLMATTVTATVWLAHQIFAPAFATHHWARPLYLFPVSRLGAYPGWITDRLLLTATIAPLAAGVLALLHRTERMLTEEET